MELSRVHRDWYNQELARVALPGDLERVLDAYDEAPEPIAVDDSPLLKQLLFHVRILAEILDSADLLTDDEQRAAVAGLRYYLHLSDEIPDFSGRHGLADDALVVQCAVHRLEPTLRRLGYLA
ncbi:MAG: hypothetical protein SF028_03000 [Candidatus Sumerlaeia bacterium]|nr:hypothetical protein [Candidatus Sumerlaeia bacterium]